MQGAAGRGPQAHPNPAFPGSAYHFLQLALVLKALAFISPDDCRSTMTSRGRRLHSFRPRGCKPGGDSCKASSVWGAVSSVPQRRGLPSSLSDRSGLLHVVKVPPASFPPSCVERTLSRAATNRHLRACRRPEAGPGPPLAFFYGGRDPALRSGCPWALVSISPRAGRTPDSCRSLAFLHTLSPPRPTRQLGEAKVTGPGGSWVAGE